MKQIDLGLCLTIKRTRKREFLAQMEQLVPWAELAGLVAPYAPEGKKGRPPFVVETMLRIHFMQQWFTLSDPAMEEALHDVPLFREFASLGWDTRLPDESTILRLRHLLEQHKLAEQILTLVNAVLTAKALLLRAGTVVDATLIAAPSSTKNAAGKRDPEMHQSRKGKQWYFGCEGPHRRGCRLGPGAYGARHGWQRQRCGPSQQLGCTGAKALRLATQVTREQRSALMRDQAWLGT